MTLPSPQEVESCAELGQLLSLSHQLCSFADSAVSSISAIHQTAKQEGILEELLQGLEDLMEKVRHVVEKMDEVRGHEGFRVLQRSQQATAAAVFHRFRDRLHVAGKILHKASLHLRKEERLLRPLERQAERVRAAQAHAQGAWIRKQARLNALRQEAGRLARALRDFSHLILFTADEMKRLQALLSEMEHLEEHILAVLRQLASSPLWNLNAPQNMREAFQALLNDVLLKIRQAGELIHGLNHNPAFDRLPELFSRNA